MADLWSQKLKTALTLNLAGGSVRSELTKRGAACEGKLNGEKLRDILEKFRPQGGIVSKSTRHADKGVEPMSVRQKQRTKTGEAG